MAADFPQELLDTIVDEVADLDFETLCSLLNSSRCFGRKCRLHLYSQVTISPTHSPPEAFRDLVTQYDVGHLVNSLCVVFSKDDTQPFWSMIGEIMSRLTQLKDVVFTELLSFQRTPPSKMLVADLPRLSTVQGVTLRYVRRLSVEDVIHVLSAFPNLSSLELSKCTMDIQESTTSTTPPVQIALETLSVLNTQQFIPSIFAGSVTPPVISLHKLRRLVVGGVFKPRIWPSYEGLFQQIQRTVKEVIIYVYPEGFPGETSLFINVPSLIVVPPLHSDFDFLGDMLQVSQVGMRASPQGLKRLALVFNWRSDQKPRWSNLADLLAKLHYLPFSVCITLAWPSDLRQASHRTWVDIQDEVLDYFKGIKRLVRVQIVELDMADWDFHMKSTEYLYY